MKRNFISALLLAGILMSAGCTQDTQTSSGGAGTSSAVSDNTEESSSSVNEESAEKAFGGLSDYSGSAYSAAASGGMLCESDSGVLLATENGIYRIEGDSTVKIYEGAATHLNSHNERVSFVDGKGNICMFSDDKVKPVIEEQGAAALITCDTGNYYIAEGVLNRIYGSRMVIADSVESMAMAEDYILFTEDEGRLCAYSSATGKTVTVADYGRLPAVCGEYLYYLSRDNGIVRMELKSGKTLDITEACGGSFAPAEDVLYFTKENSICSVSINGGEAETLYTSSAETATIDRLTYCGGRLYFTEDGTVKYLTEDGAAAPDLG